MSQVLNAGAQQAKGFMDRYANIDILRPYFNVEPSDIRTRLLQALRPRFSREPQVHMLWAGPPPLPLSSLGLDLTPLAVSRNTGHPG